MVVGITLSKTPVSSQIDPDSQKKYKANDSHICDSLSEKIIDDWLYARDIKHNINVEYPGKSTLTADFVTYNNYWIEFFGLEGKLKRYDQRKEVKIQIAREYSLNLIKLYPKDLFPENKLDNKLVFLTAHK